jgi:hypothetical protein
MNLPQLPKQRQNKEADFGTEIFKPWIDKNYKQFESASFELKDTRGQKLFNLSELKPKQKTSSLLNKSDKGNLIRVSSGTVGAADYIYLRNAYAFVVIKYPKFFAICDVNDLIVIKEKSLSIEHVNNIALTIVQV